MVKGSEGVPSADVDELFIVKTYYYIGAYQQCLNEINKLPRVSNLVRDCFMWRAYIAQNKYRVVLDAILANEKNPLLLAIRNVAEYFGIPSARSNVVKYFDETRINGLEEGDEQAIWIILASTVYHNEGMYENALRILHGQADLECMAMALQCLLKMNRLEVAKKVLAKMQEKDDDATLTQLASAWINIYSGGEKLQDAYYIYQDFCDKFIITNTLLNGQAVCLIGQERFEEVEPILNESLDKDPNNYDTLINLIVLAQQTGKDSSIISRYLNQVKELHGNSTFIQDYDKKQEEFLRISLKYEPIVKNLKYKV